MTSKKHIDKQNNRFEKPILSNNYNKKNKKNYFYILIKNKRI